MPSFSWRDAGRDRDRIPQWALGSGLWRQIVEDRSAGSLRGAHSRLQLMVDDRPLTPRELPSPRVFVSHRRDDVDLACRVAWLAVQAGFEYWLDVHDAALTALSGARLSADREALLTANIIEIALLNCSHVLAVITEQTRGSMWVPYEYGRVKKLPAGSQAGCWLAPESRRDPLTPEYLQLGVVTMSERAIEEWLSEELDLWPGGSGQHPWRLAGRWEYPEPDELPR